MIENEQAVIFRIPKISRIHWVLFISTIFTTLLAGAMMEGALVFSKPLEILKGFPFSITLMLILGTHEFGHYYYAQKHKVEATLPYFLPAPPFLFLIGTFGAFIKIKSPIYKKDALLQIGAAGPIAGFIIAVPSLLIGLKLSNVVEKVDINNAIMLGDSLLMKFLTWMTYPNLLETQDIMLHPMAFAGWIGLLVTMLNLLPIGQLDGGHIAYAMLGKKQNIIGKLAFISLIPLSFISLNWLFWGLLIFFLMRSAKHPPIHDINIPLSKFNKRIGYICLIIFILCFIPAPFNI
jgi:membrane-associated protease RseP (regulator of RpoE activity)|tara:strand:+ start:1639 stop:2514 length:876 start_codon:yes stop_codon:yes gene_type:complete